MATLADWPDTAASSITLPSGGTVRTYKLPDAKFERYVGLKYERNDTCKDTKSGIKVENLEVKGSYKLEVTESKWMPTPKKDGGFGNWTLKPKASSELIQLDLKACELAGGYVFEVKVTFPAVMSTSGSTAAKNGSTFAPASRSSPASAVPASSTSVSAGPGDWRTRLENTGKAAASAAPSTEPSKDWRDRLQAAPKPAPPPSSDWRSKLESSKLEPKVALDKANSLAKSVPASDWRSKLSTTDPSSSKAAGPIGAASDWRQRLEQSQNKVTAGNAQKDVQPTADNDWRARLAVGSTAKAEVPSKAKAAQPAAGDDWRARLAAASPAKAAAATAAVSSKANAVQPAAGDDWRARLAAASPASKAKAAEPPKADSAQAAASNDWRARLAAASPAKAEVPSKAKAADPPKANAAQPAAADDWRARLAAASSAKAEVPSKAKAADLPKANAAQPAAGGDWRTRLAAASPAKAAAAAAAAIPPKANAAQPAAADDWRARLAASTAKAEVPSKAKAADPPKANAPQPAAGDDWRTRLAAASTAKAAAAAAPPPKAKAAQPAAADDWRARLAAASTAKAEVPSKAKAADPPKGNAVPKSSSSGLRVTGAGDPRVNGEYAPDPDAIGSDPTYRLKTDRSVKIYKLGGTWKLVHSDTSGYLYVGTGDAAASATWIVGTAGKAPCPRVSTAILR